MDHAAGNENCAQTLHRSKGPASNEIMQCAPAYRKVYNVLLLLHDSSHHGINADCEHYCHLSVGGALKSAAIRAVALARHPACIPSTNETF